MVSVRPWCGIAALTAACGAALLLPLRSPRTGGASAAALYRAGQSAALRHDYPLAEADFLKARDLAPTPDQAAWAQYQIASCCLAQPSQHSQGAAALQELIRRYPSHFLAARAQEDLDRLQGKSTLRPPEPAPDVDCGPECLSYLLRHTFYRNVSVADIRRLAGTDSHGTTLSGLQKAANSLGLRAVGVKIDAAYLRHAPLPMILWVRRSHYVAVTRINASLQAPFWSLQVYDPTTRQEQSLSPDQLTAQWDGYGMTVNG